MGYLLGKNNLRDQRPHFNVITIVIRTKKNGFGVLYTMFPQICVRQNKRHLCIELLLRQNNIIIKDT
ncbi:hypothetical protein V1478_001219 [Vespula squamosa]|uniref:Uncharacterized protein n=1 Tax=Vespula squamosa TaxID=30214 RepID=A0ABD2C9U6_VESSQ